MTAVRVTKPRRLSALAAPVGIACLGVAMLLLGLGSAGGLSTVAVGSLLLALPFAAVGLWLLAIDWAWKEPTR